MKFRCFSFRNCSSNLCWIANISASCSVNKVNTPCASHTVAAGANCCIFLRLATSQSFILNPIQKFCRELKWEAQHKCHVCKCVKMYNLGCKIAAPHISYSNTQTQLTFLHTGACPQVSIIPWRNVLKVLKLPVATHESHASQHNHALSVLTDHNRFREFVFQKNLQIYKLFSYPKRVATIACGVFYARERNTKFKMLPYLQRW